jgi:hypothetical protein
MKLTGMLMLVTLIVPFEAWACRCKEPTLYTAYARANAVAMVQVKEVITLTDGVVRVTGETLQSWKSDVPQSFHVFTGDDCMYALERNSIYLLYLTRGKGDDFGTYRCRGNRHESEAADSLLWLTRYGKRSAIMPAQPAHQ